jgi:phosphoglycerol transferase MdoB-like AlkP superfamily enzyme
VVPLKICSILIVAVAMGMALAHALELPGKLRLPKEQYLAVQAIYYPGFTFGGIAEPLSMIATALLVFLMPAGSWNFWLTLGAWVALVLMQAVYWIFIQPVNSFWLKDVGLRGAGKTFFGLGAIDSVRSGQMDWRYLRDRWEYSHLARAGLAVVAFVLLVTAITG